MFKRILYFLILVCCSKFIALAAKKNLSLLECMEHAISNSSQIKIADIELSDGRLAIRDAVLSTFTPSISASTYAYYNFGRSIDPQTNTYFNLTSFHNSYSIGANFELFDGLKAVNNIKISRTGLLISHSRKKQVEADICLAVMESFYNVVYYQQLSEIFRLQLEDAKNNLKLIRKQEELGVKGYADVIQLEADLADREYDYMNTLNKFNDELTTLEALIVWDKDERLTIDCEIPQWLPEQLDAEDIIVSALTFNPAIKMARWNIENSKRELTIAKGQLLPKLSLYGGWSTSYYTYTGSSTPTFGHQFRNNGGEYIQLAISIPIYDKLKGYSDISRKKNALRQAKAELEQNLIEIESEVKRAIHDYESASVAYRQAESKSKLQQEAYNLNRKKFEQGIISPLEYQMANNNYLKAKADEMNSLFTFLIKQAVVRYYKGIDYIDQFRKQD